ncbi:MAG: winged helix-turn-helix transcriptional regulator [Fulvimarina manganoxydans]|uniref:MarR family winged helix-turn-helix transcriptional regulator n=1 Tax=Fulvimarina manganoxydans TaxID=937218 RepID=UPI0023552EED|nr:MarR family winged helix-turn-helix transcriptional regulator [Fulvimarina manganoxydans]MCK5930718.1 winged helix-turn-helix transcriptional regulator [Fulvimarina manganoxydans]
MSTMTSMNSSGVDALNANSAGMVPSLISIIKCSRVLIELRLADLGIRAGQDHLLVALDPDGEPVLTSRLADTIGVRASTASKMLDRLEMRGFMRRGESLTDRRHTTVCLTEEGRIMRERIEAVWDDVERYIFHGQSDDVVSDVRRTTAQLESILDERLRRLR